MVAFKDISKRTFVNSLFQYVKTNALKDGFLCPTRWLITV